MAPGKNVFIIGAGFIGTEILDLLHEEKYSITAFTRREQHASQLESDYGAKTIMAQLEDQAIITEQTIKHDIIIHSATADHIPSVAAILEGLKSRASKGQSTIYIHTSGTSVLDDGAHGAYKSNKIYYDNVRSEIDAVLDDAPHRPIDLTIIRAQKELGQKARIAIMTPPLIYGCKHDRLSIQIPSLTRFAIKHGYSAHVGQGLSVESNIHVSDLARGYMTLLHYLETCPAAEPLANPYWFCETTGANEPSWREVAEVIGKALHEAGKIESPEPKELKEGLYTEVLGAGTESNLGLNSRSRALRLRELGWKPREKDWKSSFLEDELPEILKEELRDFKGYTGTSARS